MSIYLYGGAHILMTIVQDFDIEVNEFELLSHKYICNILA